VHLAIRGNAVNGVISGHRRIGHIEIARVSDGQVERCDAGYERGENRRHTLPVHAMDAPFAVPHIQVPFAVKRDTCGDA
jgi:hypothetical protein